MKNTEANRFLSFRPDIDGLRAVAVFLVVASHCNVPFFTGGFVGVDVFFVLSGYLITGILVNEAHSTGRIDLPGFYARRIRRLLPASALMVLTTLLAGILLMAPLDLEFAARAARATALYLSNVFFALNGGNYFGQAVQGNPLLHTWSLAVEEQFYVIWPFAILLGIKLGRKALPWILGLILIGSLLASLTLSSKSPVYSYYGLHTRAWEFAVGGLAGILPVGGLRLNVAAARILSWAGFVGVFASAAWISSEAGYPGYQALFPVFATILVLACAKEIPGVGAVPLLSSAPFQSIGAVSYSWYLWHWPFLVMASTLLVEISLIGKIVAALLALVVAAVSYRLVENPIRRAPKLVASRLLSFTLGAVLTVSSAGIAMAVARYARHVSTSPQLTALTQAAEDISSMRRDACVNLRDSSVPLQCSYGDPNSHTTVILFGDSHAVQWFDAFLKAAANQDWRLITFLKSGCPAADISPRDLSPADQEACALWRHEVFAEVGKLQPALVAFASATTTVKQGPEALQITAAEWEAATSRTLAALAPNTRHALLILDTPRPGFDVPSCLARHLLHPTLVTHDCGFSEQRSVNLAARQAEQSAVKAVSAGTLDPLALLCASGRCAASKDGVVTYRDDNHLTGAFARSLAPAVEETLRKQLSDTAP